MLAATDPGSPHAVLPAPSVVAVLTVPDVTPEELDARFGREVLELLG